MLSVCVCVCVCEYLYYIWIYQIANLCWKHEMQTETKQITCKCWHLKIAIFQWLKLNRQTLWNNCFNTGIQSVHKIVWVEVHLRCPVVWLNCIKRSEVKRCTATNKRRYSHEGKHQCTWLNCFTPPQVHTGQFIDCCLFGLCYVVFSPAV